MELQSGRILLSWGNEGYTAATDAAASNHEIETAIRNAIRLPPVALIPDKPAPVPALATPTSGQPMATNPADTMNALDRVMTDHVRMMGDIHAAQLKILEATLDRQRQSIANGVGAMATRIDQQTDDFNAMMARWTNGAPA